MTTDLDDERLEVVEVAERDAAVRVAGHGDRQDLPA
jgi:hypothetical protein